MAGSSGPGGIFTLALSAIDMACWDLKGKAAGPAAVRSCSAALRDRVPTYASGALTRASIRWTTWRRPARGWWTWASAR